MYISYIHTIQYLLHAHVLCRANHIGILFCFILRTPYICIYRYSVRWHGDLIKLTIEAVKGFFFFFFCSFFFWFCFLSLTELSLLLHPHKYTEYNQYTYIFSWLCCMGVEDSRKYNPSRKDLTELVVPPINSHPILYVKFYFLNVTPYCSIHTNTHILRTSTQLKV